MQMFSLNVALKVLHELVLHSGRALITIGITLIFAIPGTLLYTVIPLLTHSSSKENNCVRNFEIFLPVYFQVQASLLASIEFFLVFNIYLNYVLCISTDPGRLPRGKRVSNGTYDFDIEHGCLEEQLSYCAQCDMWRSKRAHHCSMCRQCINCMDHHCPWINNCVGYNNYRYFVSLLLWVAAGCIYGVILSYRLAFVPLVNYPLLNVSFGSTILSQKLCQFVFAISSLVATMVSVLIIWHSYLIATAQTSVEYQIHRVARKQYENYRNPNDTGSFCGNLLLVYGSAKEQKMNSITFTSILFNTIDISWSIMFPEPRNVRAKATRKAHIAA